MSIQFVCSGLTYEIYSGSDPSMYIYCLVCYRVTAAPYVRKIVVSLHTVTLLMTICNAQRTMGSLTYLTFFFITGVRYAFNIHQWPGIHLLDSTVLILLIQVC